MKIRKVRLLANNSINFNSTLTQDLNNSGILDSTINKKIKELFNKYALKIIEKEI